MRLPEQLSRLSAKTWSGLTSFIGNSIWTDGTNTYYSRGTDQYVLDKATNTWLIKTWTVTIYANRIWTDGTNIYYSDDTNQYVLNKATSTWQNKTWTGLTSFGGKNIWTDGTNTYYSSGTDQYILDKETSTWSPKTWNGLTSFDGVFIWTDGTNIYYNGTVYNYVLDKATSTWLSKTWINAPDHFYTTGMLWTDGTNTYYSSNTKQYVLDKATSTWQTKTWNGLTNFTGSNIWTDGTNTYYSSGTDQYEFLPPPTYTIDTAQVPHGLINVDEYAAYEGNVIGVIVTPDSGYKLKTINVNGTAITGTSFTMPAEDVTVSAEFVENVPPTAIDNKYLNEQGLVKVMSLAKAEHLQIFTGTQAEWDALDSSEKDQYDIAEVIN